MESNISTTQKVKIDSDSIYATGKRKRSIAKVWLRKGSGKIIVNGKNLDNYFKRDIYQSTDYDVNCKVVGGGLTGQAGALVHGISKALVQLNSELKSTLKKEKLTTRDSRSVERKKPGRAKARRSYQFSKR